MIPFDILQRVPLNVILVSGRSFNKYSNTPRDFVTTDKEENTTV
jgi:hypothetical protein